MANAVLSELTQSETNTVFLIFESSCVSWMIFTSILSFSSETFVCNEVSSISIPQLHEMLFRLHPYAISIDCLHVSSYQGPKISDAFFWTHFLTNTQTHPRKIKVTCLHVGSQKPKTTATARPPRGH